MKKCKDCGGRDGHMPYCPGGIDRMTRNANPLPADIIELIEQVRLDSQIPWCIRACVLPLQDITPAQARATNKALGLDSADTAAVFNHINER